MYFVTLTIKDVNQGGYDEKIKKTLKVDEEEAKKIKEKIKNGRPEDKIYIEGIEGDNVIKTKIGKIEYFNLEKEEEGPDPVDDLEASPQ